MILNLILPDAQRAQAVPQIVKVLLPATNADRSIAGANRVARAEDAAAPYAVQGANWGWKGWRGGRGS